MNIVVKILYENWQIKSRKKLYIFYLRFISECKVDSTLENQSISSPYQQTKDEKLHYDLNKCRKKQSISLIATKKFVQNTKSSYLKILKVKHFYDIQVKAKLGQRLVFRV